MASNNNGIGGKEERRRRIAERGSDRMALITGRINALPPTPTSAASSPIYPRHGQTMSASVFDEYLGGAEDSKNDASIASRLKHQGGFKYSNFETKHEEEEPLIKDSNTIPKSKTKSSSKSKQTGSVEAKKPRSWRKHTFFSSRELNFCILASENTRALSSLIIALLVVFYYTISESILASRPLYIVLVTDVTIVVARIYREKTRFLEEKEGDKGEAGEDGHSWGDAVKLLERGLVLYQAIRGVFIDCSIYLVVVVCCISLM